MVTLVIIALVVNVLVVAGLAYGISKRREPAIHMKVMTTCFIVDLLNVVLVEVENWMRTREGASKGAVQTAGENFVNDPWSLLNFHIVVSVISIVCYIIAIRTGRRLYRASVDGAAGSETGKTEGTQAPLKLRSLHRKNALVFVVARLASFVTSFVISWPNISGGFSGS
jgi:uncharacterized membrane protein YozB (DUF420 family)